jgi:transposase
MGKDPSTSVVDKFGRTRDIPNLFVCDGSILPAQGSADLGLTIQALAARTADYLNKQADAIFFSDCRDTFARALRKQGRQVRPIAAQFVKLLVKSNKNDFVDAEVIAEAVERENMRFVPIKTDDQLDMQAIHRFAIGSFSRRTAVINQLRSFLLERGTTFAKTPRSHERPCRDTRRRRRGIDAIDPEPHRVGQTCFLALNFSLAVGWRTTHYCY